MARRNLSSNPSKYARDRLAFEEQHLAELEKRLRTLLSDEEVKVEPK